LRSVGLARALSKLGYCSRSQAQQLIREGRVQVNGAVKHDPEAAVFLGRDRIEVDGGPIRSAEKMYLMLNKPRGLVTTAADEKGRPTVYSKVGGDLPWLAPVGRLDKASEGMLLLTNDSEWAARVLAPATHLEKTYHVQIDRVADAGLLDSLVRGVKTEEGSVLRAGRVRILRSGERNSWLEMVLDEGKNRHIRRIFEALGIAVLRLVRVAIGNLQLGELPKGQCRQLTREEIRALTSTDHR